MRVVEPRFDDLRKHRTGAADRDLTQILPVEGEFNSIPSDRHPASSSHQRARRGLRACGSESRQSSALAPAKLLHVIAKFLRARGLAELAQCIGLDLADPLPGQ